MDYSVVFLVAFSSTNVTALICRALECLQTDDIECRRVHSSVLATCASERVSKGSSFEAGLDAMLGGVGN
jgi:hypothetical protein